MQSDHENELKLYEKDIDILRLSAQLSMVPDLLLAYNDKNPQTAIKKVTNPRTVSEIFNDITYSKTMFSEVFKLLHIILTISVITATQPKDILHRLKMYLHSTMSQSKLNNVMILNIKLK